MNGARPTVALAATLDTKAAAADVVRHELERRGVDVLVIDCALRAHESTGHGDVPAGELAELGGGLPPEAGRPERLAVIRRGLGLRVAELHGAGRLDGFVAIGGGTGAAIAAEAFAALPITMPAMLISTQVTGGVEDIVGPGAVVLIQPVVDIVGSGALLDLALRRGAATLATLVGPDVPRRVDSRPHVAITAFGVTTPAAERAVEVMTGHGWQTSVFHARGSGGRALEALARADEFDAILDLTTTEIADEVAGGLRSAGSGRLDATARGVPTVLAPGAIDVLNFAGPSTVPEALRDRPRVEHTPLSTLVRTSKDESRAIAAWISGKIAGTRSLMLIPDGGYSDLDRPGRPFHDPDADAAFTDEITAALPAGMVHRISAHINDPTFADEACAALLELHAAGSSDPARHTRVIAPGSSHRAHPRRLRERTRMKRHLSRDTVLARLCVEIEAGRQIVATGAGSGLVARVADRSDVDLIVVYASGKFRQDGLPSVVGALPVANANEVMLELGRERIFPVVTQTPVVGGVYTHDPTRDLDDLFEEMIATGYSGVINFPTVGRIDGGYRADLESLGFGFAQEVEMLRRAQGYGLITFAYVYTPDETKAVVRAGVDVVVAHGGITGGGDVGLANPRGLDTTIETFNAIFGAARAARPDIVVLTHGGPIITPEDAAEVAARTGAHGFVGASSTERIPIENALKAAYAAFKSGPAAPDRTGGRS